MKILKFKGKMSNKNKILISIAIALSIFLISIILLYILNENVQTWININILRKEVIEEDIASIPLDTDKLQYIRAYDRYISLLCNGKLQIYNSYASKEAELDIQISTPIYDINNNYLAIAEKNGGQIYLLSDTKVLWDTKVEGNIKKIHVSKTGYVSVLTTGSGYKSVVIVFDKDGKELFKTFLTTLAVDMDISVNGKYLGIAEVNTSGVLIKSSIKIVDIDKAINGEAGNSIVFIYNSDSNDMIRDIKYQERGQLVCIYDNSIHMINNDKDEVLLEFKNTTQISDINLKSYVIRTEEIKTGLFKVKTDVILKNILTGAESTYSVNSSVKQVVTYNQIAAINLGAEIHFINLNGWLQKKYTSKQEPKEITLGSSVAGIVYRDRIKILTF